MRFNCSGQNLTTLKDITFPEGVIHLYCHHNRLTTLEGCPDTVVFLDCSSNLLQSLKHCPKSVIYLVCSNNQLQTLEYCPFSITCLAWDNPLRELKHYIPETPTLKEIAVSQIIRHELGPAQLITTYKQVMSGVTLCLNCEKGVYQSKRKRIVTKYDVFKIPNWVCINC